MRYITGMLAVVLFVLISMTSGEAFAKRRSLGIPLFIFGQSDETICLQDVTLTGNDGSGLCLAEYNVYTFIFAGIGTSSELVLAEKVGNRYYQLPTGDELATFQTAGLLPTPLPTYSRPIIDYLYGYSLWILLALGLGGYAIVSVSRRGSRAKVERHAAANFEACLRRVLASAMLADGMADDDERSTIKDVFQKVTGKEFADGDLDTLTSKIMQEKETVIDSISRFKSLLNDGAKSLILKSAILVLCADEHLSEQEWRFVADVAAGLAVSEAELRDLISTMFASTGDEVQTSAA